MICPKCGNETSGNYCSNCGAPLMAGPAGEIERKQASGSGTPTRALYPEGFEHRGEMEPDRLGERGDMPDQRSGRPASGTSGHEKEAVQESRNQSADSVPSERQAAPKKEKPGGSSKKEASSKDSQKESQKEKKQLEKRIHMLEEERQQREKEERQKSRQKNSGEESEAGRRGRGESGPSRRERDESGLSRRDGSESGVSRRGGGKAGSARSRADTAGLGRRDRDDSGVGWEAEDDFTERGGRRVRSRRNPEQEDGGENVRIIRETEESGRSVGGSIADAAVKGVTGVVILMSRVMQVCCFLLMAGMVWVSARAFWFCSDGLGTIDTMITEQNYSLALYVGTAAFSLFMGAIWCLWILSRKAAGGNIRLKKYDTGRGFIPFILCAAVIFAAGPASMLIPADGAAWHGLAAGAKAVLEAINSNHGFLVFCSVAGIILSLVRKLLRV